MTVYVILDIEITDIDIFPEYRDKVGAVVRKFGARFIVKGGKTIPLFGDWDAHRITIVEFPSLEHMYKCIESPEYLAVKAIRDKSAITSGILVEETESA